MFCSGSGNCPAIKPLVEVAESNSSEPSRHVGFRWVRAPTVGTDRVPSGPAVDAVNTRRTQRIREYGSANPRLQVNNPVSPARVSSRRRTHAAALPKRSRPVGHCPGIGATSPTARRGRRCRIRRRCRSPTSGANSSYRSGAARRHRRSHVPRPGRTELGACDPRARPARTSDPGSSPSRVAEVASRARCRRGGPPNRGPRVGRRS